MTSNDKGSSRPGPGARRKRPTPPTIDLTATEVAAAPAAPPETPPAAEPMPEAPPAAEAPETVSTLESRAAAAPDPAPVAAKVDAGEPVGAAAEPARPEPAPAAAWSSDTEPPPGAPPFGDAPPPAAAAPDRTWPRSGAAIAAAVALGLILIAVLWGLFGRDDGTAQLSQRIAALETQARQLADKPAQADPRVADLIARLAAAEQALRRLDGSVATGLGRLQQAEERVGKIEAAPAPAQAAPDPALGNRITQADAALKTLAERLAALEAALRPVAAQADSAAATDQGLADRTATAEAALKSLREQLDELGRTVADTAQLARAAAQQAGAVAKEQKSGADRAVRLAVAATALRDVVMRGEPFGPELAAVKPLASDPARVAPLEAFAATGLPSGAALARELSGLLPAVVAAATPPRGEGMLDRLQTSAERFVRIRPVNETPGDDPLPVIARIEARAAAGEVDAARGELAKLPENARAPAQAWSQKVEKRAAALAAAHSLARDAVAALAKE